MANEHADRLREIASARRDNAQGKRDAREYLESIGCDVDATTRACEADSAACEAGARALELLALLRRNAWAPPGEPMRVTLPDGWLREIDALLVDGGGREG